MDLILLKLITSAVLIGSGAIRLEQMGPIVTLGGLTETYPYDDPIIALDVTGAQLRRMFSHIFRDEAWTGHTEFYQVSAGTRLVFGKGTHTFEVFEIAGGPVDDERMYSVAVTKYHFENVQDFLGITLEEFSKNGAPRTLSTSTRDLMVEYLCSHANLDRVVEGRMVIK